MRVSPTVSKGWNPPPAGHCCSSDPRRWQVQTAPFRQVLGLWGLGTDDFWGYQVLEGWA